MKRIFLISGLLIAGATTAQKTDFKASLDSMLTHYQKNNAFSGSILLQKNGETIYKGEFNNFPGEKEKYRIGSITKIFTSVMIFQLVEEGKLKLGSTLNTYFPTVKNADRITIAQMLNHTSGMFNYLEWDEYYDSKDKVFTKEAMLKIIQQGKPDFKPGKDSMYSNSGYLLLGYIIEQVTGKSYQENLKTRILDKVGLYNTYSETDPSQYSKRAASYKFDGEKWSHEADTHPSFTYSAGNIVSTTEDLAKMMKALFSGKLVSMKTVDLMKQTNPQTHIGYGLFRTPIFGKAGFGHTGRIDEFHAGLAHIPEDKFTVAVLANGTNVKLNDIVVAVVSKYYGKNYKELDFTTYTDKNAAPTHIYEGVYNAKLGGIISVGKFRISKAGKNHLFLSMYSKASEGKQSRTALLKRIGENEFYSFDNSANLQFDRDKSGKVTGLKLTQGQQSINCSKIL
ncbi:beta-lactamase family protein [Marnyiella aurantia]|uniref:Beta-lactamase family protein n=1 Tax=Marnyiella aurantia TaxID=2758037 RepID=A0A7D7QU19_9FLAO|nr:serine hydrolase domain-containing protein [Marnyiella aurantia]MBA5245959.1 beta-lactamase family protein [Marnyiella aurantia]QMS98647.1 beta-lactamase family protein [Marnyiella aurantia]